MDLGAGWIFGMADFGQVSEVEVALMGYGSQGAVDSVFDGGPILGWFETG